MATIDTKLILMRCGIAACTTLAAVSLAATWYLPLFAITSPTQHAGITQSFWATNVYTVTDSVAQLQRSSADSRIPLFDLLLRIGRVATILGVVSLALAGLYSSLCVIQFLAASHPGRNMMLGMPFSMLVIVVVTCCATRILYETNWYDATPSHTARTSHAASACTPHPTVELSTQATAACETTAPVCDPFNKCLTSFRAMHFQGAVGWTLIRVGLILTLAAYCLEILIEEVDEEQDTEQDEEQDDLIKIDADDSFDGETGSMSAVSLCDDDDCGDPTALM